MSRGAWAGCALVLSAAVTLGVVLGWRAHRLRVLHARVLLHAPATWLFVVYLIAAGLLVPTTEGETTSPLVGLAAALSALVLVSGAASAGAPARAAVRLPLAALFAAAMLCAGAVVLALLSPRWVPAWLR